MKRFSFLGGAGLALIIAGGIFGQGAFSSILHAKPKAYAQGYVPFFAALGLALCGATLLFEAVRRGANSRDSLQWGKVARGPGITILSLIACVTLMNALGFALSTFLLMLLFLRLFRVFPWFLSLLISGLIAVSFHYIFRAWLLMPLPMGVLFS